MVRLSRRAVLSGGFSSVLFDPIRIQPAGWAKDIRRPNDTSPVIRVISDLKRPSARRLLTGISARLIGPPIEDRPSVTLRATDEGAWVSLETCPAPVLVRSALGAEGLVAAWSLPVLGVGAFTGFDPADLSVLFPACSGSFFRVPLGAALPREARSVAAAATGAHLLFLGEDLDLMAIQSSVEKLDRNLAPSAHRLFATSEVRGNRPALLLTLFT